MCSRAPLAVRRRLLELYRELPASSRSLSLLVSRSFDVLPIELRQLLEDRDLERSCGTEIERYAGEGIQAVAIGEPAFPPQLAEISLPPLLLWYRGREPLATQLPAALAIVGSRRADQEGTLLAFSFAKALRAGGVTIVSGLALGIDAAAHRGALDAPGEGVCTVAVLGSGLASPYPASNTLLAREIVERGGTVLSEYPPQERPRAHYFLERNRIIAGLSLGVLVVQAPEKSGALATARFAVEEGREVLVVPGSIHSQLYKGSHRLIRSGAVLVGGVGEIIEALPQLLYRAPATQSLLPELAPLEQRLLDLLEGAEPVPSEKLHQAVNDQGELSALLTTLELKGYLRRLPGNLIQRAELEIS